MKILTLFGLALLVCVACGKYAGQNSPAVADNAESTGAVATPTPVVAVSEKGTHDGIDVPSAYPGLDFRNFSYPTNLRGKITLQEGKRIYQNPEGGGGDSFELREVGVADLNGDDRKEAIVHLVGVACGGSCDGGSHLFYFYSVDKNKAKLLARIETGSNAYGECGLKSFVLSKRKLVLDLFQVCRVRGVSFISLKDSRSSGSKFDAASFTRFLFEFSGKRFKQKTREIFPFPQRDVRNYDEIVTIE